MPSKNTVKFYEKDGFYHVYNRGVNKRRIFLDDQDYRFFIGLLARYFGPVLLTDLQRRTYPNYSEEVDVLAYCLMPNHFHLLMQQRGDSGLTNPMRSVMNAYVAYFNKKYERVGYLHQGIFKAVSLKDEAHLILITKYIHKNPQNYSTWPYSTYNNYITRVWPTWLKPQYILDDFLPGEYQCYIEDKIFKP